MASRFIIKDWIMFGGAALVALGLFLPIVTLPFAGSITYMGGGNDGPIILGLTLTIGLLVFFGYRFIGALIGLGIASLLTITFIRFLAAFHNMSAEASALAEDNPFGGIALIAAKSVGFGVGWLPLLAGVGMIIGAGLATPLKSKALAQKFFSSDEEFVELDPDETIKRYVARQSASGRGSVGKNDHRGGSYNKTFGRRTHRG